MTNWGWRHSLFCSPVSGDIGSDSTARTDVRGWRAGEILGKNNPHLSAGAFGDSLSLDFNDYDWREENLIGVTIGVVIPQSLCVSDEPEFGGGEGFKIPFQNSCQCWIRTFFDFFYRGHKRYPIAYIIF